MSTFRVGVYNIDNVPLVGVRVAEIGNNGVILNFGDTDSTGFATITPSSDFFIPAVLINGVREQFVRTVTILDMALSGGPVGPHTLDDQSAHTDVFALAEATGDLLYRVEGKWERLPIGVNGDYLTVSVGKPDWASVAVGAHNIMSSSHSDVNPAYYGTPNIGDIMYGVGGNQWGKLAITGQRGVVLTHDGFGGIMWDTQSVIRDHSVHPAILTNPEFRLDIVSGEPAVVFDAFDYQDFVEASNIYRWIVGGIVRATLDGSGNYSPEGYLSLKEISDPAAIANRNLLYAKDSNGITRLYSRTDIGGITAPLGVRIVSSLPAFGENGEMININDGVNANRLYIWQTGVTF